jgi:hypothetical protein
MDAKGNRSLPSDGANISNKSDDLEVKLYNKKCSKAREELLRTMEARRDCMDQGDDSDYEVRNASTGVSPYPRDFSLPGSTAISRAGSEGEQVPHPNNR